MVQARRIQLRRLICQISVLLCAVCASVPALAQLETRVLTKVPGEALGIVSGDFNMDGNLDVAVASSSRLLVLLGNGDGTFQRPETYSYEGLGFSVASADFNGDGKLDLVINGPGNAVSVLLGNGDGTFKAPLVSSVTEAPSFIAVGDFNRDHKMDIAVVDPPYISVLLGNGDGTFQAPINNDSFPDDPVWLIVGDFNNDHLLDVAVVGYFGSNIDMGVLLGNGDGTLQPSLISPLNNTPYSIAAGDFNQDGNLDVAISGYFVPGDVVVRLGNGDGSFQPGVDYPTTGAGGQVVVDDFNGDGKLDLILGGVGLLLGNGDGTFGPVQIFPVAGSPLVVGDFNGDRKPDVVGLLSKPEGAATLLNTGVVNFSSSSPVSFPSQLINTISGSQTVNLTNTGATALSISSMKVSGPFQMTTTCGRKVEAAASCAISAAFSPIEPYQEIGLVTIRDSASSKPQVIELSGLGTAVKLSPTSLDFGSQKIGTTSPPQQINVTNEGSVTLSFNRIAIGGKDFKDFSLVSDTCTNLAAGASCVANVIFDPTKAGARVANFNMVVRASGSPAPVVLTGIGTDAPK